MTSDVEALEYRVLLVDDNPSIHEDFRKILRERPRLVSAEVVELEARMFGIVVPEPVGARFETESAFQGEDALARVDAAEEQGRPFSLAFVDVRMPPGWDGIETITRIWKRHPDLQIVLCTAFSDYSWEEIRRRFGETDSLVILRKPVDNVEVLQLAHTLTKKWTLTRQARARLAGLDEIVRQRTHELRASEERFRKAFETISIALSIWSVDGGECIDANRSFAQLSGFSKAELLGQTPDQLKFFADPERWREAVSLVASGMSAPNTELAIRCKAGKTRQVVLSVDELSLGDRRCTLATFLDVTDQRRLETQLRQSQKMEAVGRLAAGIAHDFNNLLTVIHGYASLQLAKPGLETDVTKGLLQIKFAAERASALTKQLLTFSRKQVLQRKPVALESTLLRMQNMLSRMLGETIRLETVCAPGLPFVDGDESGLEQVIMNLAVNARDAMPNGGQLRFKAALAEIGSNEAAQRRGSREGQFIEFSVSDTGTGMDAETLSRIFEPFYTTKPVGRGTGLGLATVYGIVQQHEGWIDVKSQLGRGTTFSVFLPTTRSAPKENISSPNAQEIPRKASSATDLILLAEDEPHVREFVRLVLTGQGYQVLSAASGPEALKQWNHRPEKIRLLLTDMVMPDGMSGSVLARQLLQCEPNLKVIYMSGYSPEVMANEGALNEGLNFLSKPFSRDTLLTAVRRALTSNTPAVELISAQSHSN